MKNHILSFILFILFNVYILCLGLPVQAKEIGVSGDYGVYQAQYKNRNGTITIISSSQYVSSNNVVGDGTAYTWFSARESLITPTITQYNYYVMPEFRVFANANFKAGSFYTLNCQWGAGGEVQKTFQNGLLSSSVGGLMSGASDYDTTVVSNVSVSYSDQYFTVTFKALQDFNSVRFRFGNQELISNNQYTTLLLSNNSDYQQGFRIYVLNLVEADDLNSALLGQITNQNQIMINQNQQIIDKVDGIAGAGKDIIAGQEKSFDYVSDNTDIDTSQIDGLVGYLPPGPLDSIINLPLSMLNSMQQNLQLTCSPLSFPVPFVSARFEIPCISTLYEKMGATTLINSLGTILATIILYKYFLYLYNWVDNILSLKSARLKGWGSD